LAFFLWRRRSTNVRRGPRNEKDAKFSRQVAPRGITGDKFLTFVLRSSGPLGHSFEPLSSSYDAPDARLDPHYNVPAQVQRNSDGVSAESDPIFRFGLQEPHSHEPVSAAVTRGEDRNYDSDRVPLTRELDDFSQGFNTALEDITVDSDGEANHNNMANYPGPRRGGGGSVLWQQNRRQSRNLAWM
jgi:hypothetical protein